eukprot:m.354054 g.354054  ORF g.354054 m.354054 type:complete len:205 (+) comp16909_c0_seq1:1078-1692(+)
MTGAQVLLVLGLTLARSMANSILTPHQLLMNEEVTYGSYVEYAVLEGSLEANGMYEVLVSYPGVVPGRWSISLECEPQTATPAVGSHHHTRHMLDTAKLMFPTDDHGTPLTHDGKACTRIRIALESLAIPLQRAHADTPRSVAFTLLLSPLVAGAVTPATLWFLAIAGLLCALVVMLFAPFLAVFFADVRKRLQMEQLMTKQQL